MAIFAVASLRIATASDRLTPAGAGEFAAAWVAGISERDLHVLAAMSAAAAADVRAARVEVVLLREADGEHGIVVTGVRVPPERFGRPVPVDDGPIGRALGEDRTTVSEDSALICVPIRRRDRVIGVLAVTGGTGAIALVRLEALVGSWAPRLEGPSPDAEP